MANRLPGKYRPNLTGSTGSRLPGKGSAPGTSSNILYDIKKRSHSDHAGSSTDSSSSVKKARHSFGGTKPSDLTSMVNALGPAKPKPTGGMASAGSTSAESANKSADKGLPDGVLSCTLYRHQEAALQWMKEKELNRKNKGGILADEMGLGKTVTTISLMLSHKADPSSPGVKTNLIVAPNALLKQWAEEIKKKILPRHSMSVFEHHTRKGSWEVLRKHDVVLTTYGSLMSELKTLEQLTKKTDGKDPDISDDELTRCCPLLGPHCVFLRVILDEAQNIKNRKAKCASAAYLLKATYRWCLTGTPMQNGPKDLASLIHFLKIAPWSSFDLFSENFKVLEPRNRGSETQCRAAEMQLSAILNDITLQRNMRTKIDGKPILDMVQKVEVVDHAVFDEVQRKFYIDLQQNSQIEISTYMDDGTVGLRYQKMKTLFLRLRQACCHPQLIPTDGFAGEENFDSRTAGAAKRIKEDRTKRIIEGSDAFKCSFCDKSIKIKSPHIMSPCGHSLCDKCIDEFIEEELEEGRRADKKKNMFRCVRCVNGTSHAGPKGSEMTSFDAIQALYDSRKADNALLDALPLGDGAKKEAKHGKGKAEHHDEDEEDGDSDTDDGGDWEDEVDDDTGMNVVQKLREKSRGNQQAREHYMQYLHENWKPSAKVSKCADIIEEVLKTTQEKVIVFSSWTFFLDLIEVYIINRLKVKVTRYDGSLSGRVRDKRIHEFNNDPEAKIILMSLRAGNAGLNLTVASQVIIMDPFWNPYVEDQAIGRAYRIGQTRKVTVHRILVKGTVEDQITARQQEKRDVIESVREGEKSGAIRNASTLTATELLGLLMVAPSL
ncbi:SNF2 family N-terminal domain-containing protein [Hypoxylon trugodes]|uniref:SNF2 family N-terminal domain-containing protein n=1 Tax=Hypoxylon trugodes TaxID=326681 RepID=UPI00219C18DB|nr:SNF2 family N-terminal domain-containing protein [Hypoxylon trugodes]KAI1392536.1 SNF2 family N-terminal domain-containing protein [Hypoxylon trugodes]